jgi:hypothetical protein
LRTRESTSGEAVRLGFEPRRHDATGFQDRRNRPLCHLTVREMVGRGEG